jgi:hypothetical protein
MNKETFEIHITGANEDILKEFEDLNIKTLEINLLSKDKTVVGKENMCCLVVNVNSYYDAAQIAGGIILDLKSKIARVKIECPLYEQYLGQAIYAEVHYPQSNVLDSFPHPTVYNIKSDKYISTRRVYGSTQDFINLYNESKEIPGSEFELCLMDSNINFDDYWLSFYGEVNKE